MKYSTIINKIVSKNGGSRPILSNARILDGRLHFTDMEIGLILTSPNLDICGDDFCVPAHQLAKLMDSKGFLQGRVEERTLSLWAGKAKFKLPSYSTEVFPDIPMPSRIDNKRVELHDDFMEALKRASTCANKDKSRYGLNSIKLDFNNGVAVATDQVRLSAQKMQTIAGESPIIPMKAFELLKALPIPSCIQFESDSLYFLHDDYILVTKLVEAQYPQYMSAIATYSKRDVEIRLDKCILNDALKDLDLMACENAYNCKLENSTISISTPLGEASYDFDRIEHVTNGINIQFLKDYVKTLDKAECFTLGLSNEPKKPITLKNDNGVVFFSPCAI